MVKKKICRIFVFFVVLIVLVNVSFSFKNSNGLVQLDMGRKVYAAAPITGTYVTGTETYYIEYCGYVKPANCSYSFNPDTSVLSISTLNSDIIGWARGNSTPSAYARGDVTITVYGMDKSDPTLEKPLTSKSWRLEDFQANASVCIPPTESWYYPTQLSLPNVYKITRIHYNVIMYSDGFYANKDSDAYLNITNSPPIMSLISPSSGAILSELNTCAPSITVSDPKGYALTCKYYIDDTLMDTEQAFNTVSSQTVSFKAPDISKIAEGSRRIKFEVSDGTYDPVTQTIGVLVDKSAPSIGNVTAASDDNSITVSGTATDTVTDTSALQYRYTIGSTVSNWVTDTSWKAGSLASNASYNIKFEAKDSTGHIASSEKSVYTKAQIPQITIGNIKETSMDINLSDSNPVATEYQIMVGSDWVNNNGTLCVAPRWITLTGKKITVIGLSPNVQYVIKAKARNNDGAETAFSAQTAATTLALPPSGITKEQGINSIKISWNAVNSATGYDIEADGKAVDTGTATSYTHSGLQAETTHSYRVRTKNSSGTGPWSEYINVTTLPNPPDTPAIANTETTYSAITINWNTVAKATGYEIEADGKTIDAGSATTYTDSGLQPDTSHKYRIRAKNAGGASEWSAYTETGTLPLPPEIPSNLKGLPSKNNITLTWSAADRAEGYELENT